LKGGKMKRVAFLGLIISCSVIITLVLSSFGLAQQATPKAKDFKWPAVIRVATSGTATAGFASTNGWVPKLQAAISTMVRAIPEDSEARRYIRFNENKDFEVASISVAEGSFAVQGEGGYAEKKAYPMRLVWHHNDTPWSFAVRGDSEFKTLYHLKKKGVRVALATASPSMMSVVQEALPAFIGWTKEEAKQNWVFVPAGSYGENCRTVTDGKADVSYVSPISSVTYEMEAHPKKLRWLPMPFTDKAAWKRFLKIRPQTIPATIDWGVPTAIGIEGLTSNYLYWTRPDVDQETIYHLAKWLNEGFDSYKDTHKAASRMSLKHFRKFLDYSPSPVSEGTIRYLKEIGQWTAADDKWNEEAIKLMDRWIKARDAAIAEAKTKGVKIHWEDKAYLDILKKHTARISPFTARVE
jgi:TRAP transporter TAXI family solute receptor